MWKYTWRITLGVILIIVGYFGYGIVMLSGVTRSFENTLVDQCRRVEVAPGTEDVQYDPETGLVFITSDNRRAVPGEHGGAVDPELLKTNGIYALDVSAKRLDKIGKPYKVSPAKLKDFRPHGLSLWSDGKGTKRLFVVSHPTSGKEIVEIFDVGKRGKLSHLQSVSFPDMFNPNDVVGVGPNQFYATNFLKNRGGLMVYAEILMALPLTSAVYFDGEIGRTVVTQLAFANGINTSPDGSEVYIAEWSKQRIYVFERRENNNLKPVRSIDFPTAVDNLDVDEDGNIWFAGQPRMFQFFDAIEDPDAVVTSVGVKVDPVAGTHDTVFASTKGEINASSVAAVAGDKLVIGAVFDSHILICPKPE